MLTATLNQITDTWPMTGVNFTLPDIITLIKLISHGFTSLGFHTAIDSEIIHAFGPGIITLKLKLST